MTEAPAPAQPARLSYINGMTCGGRMHGSLAIQSLTGPVCAAGLKTTRGVRRRSAVVVDVLSGTAEDDLALLAAFSGLLLGDLHDLECV